MNKRLTKLGLLSTAISCGLTAAGCSSGDTASSRPPSAEVPKSTASKPTENLQPVTLNVFNGRSSEVGNYWDQLLTEPLKKKYPHITINQIKGDITKVVAEGTPIDVYIMAHVDLGNFIQLDLADDIEPLMKTHNMSLSRFDPNVIQTLRAISPDGKKLLGIPFYLQFTTLYYNKDIFDILGVPYPKDGMTWDDTIQLAKKVSATHDGKAYLGFKADQAQRMADPLGITSVDPKTNKASVNNDKYKKVFQLTQQFFSIPGNGAKDEKDVNAGPVNLFAKDKALAMYFGVNRFPTLQKADVNWDIAQSPYYPDKPNYGGIIDSFMAGVSKTSKHKDDAFRVLEVFTSDENQLYSSRALGYVSPLLDKRMQEQFGAELDFLKGKNVQAIFKSKNAIPDPMSIYRNDSLTILLEEHGKYIMGQQDVNTALKTAEERINKKIESLAH
ncbi:ABC transporter substrate-binding protein [Paenibacillus ginsengarvi]|nr:extracellular solute-binding protein [Paenibacillus ginsengarvi]